MTTKDNNAIRSIHELFSEWEQEDQRIEKQLGEIRDWMNQASELGVPCFGDTGEQLKAFRQVLITHFEQEDDLCDRLSQFYPSPCPELDAMGRQARGDHSNLIGRINQLVENLDAIEPSFDSFQCAIDQVDLLMVAIEQHEEYESDSVRALLPPLPPKT